MKVNTVEVDADTLSATKVVEFGSHQLETPAKALQVGKLHASETVTPLARGVAEIYRKANKQALNNSRSGWAGLAKHLNRQAKNARDDEMVVPFVEYDETGQLSKANAKEIAKLQSNYGDVLTVPLMTPLVDAAEDGDGPDSSYVQVLIENAEKYLEGVGDLEIEKPIMGTIPPISDDCTRALLDIYAEWGLQAYCVDFNRRSPMAQSQIDHVIVPLMKFLREYNLMNKSLVYAVNLDPSRKVEGDRRTSDVMYAYTEGFDIVGDNHIAPKLPEEVLEQIKKENREGEVTMRLFDADTISIVEVPVSDLKDFLPSEAKLPVERIQNRISQSPDDKYRFRKLINAELISIFLKTEDGFSPDGLFSDIVSSPHTLDYDIDRIEKIVQSVRG